MKTFADKMFTLHQLKHNLGVLILLRTRHLIYEGLENRLRFLMRTRKINVRSGSPPRPWSRFVENPELGGGQDQRTSFMKNCNHRIGAGKKGEQKRPGR